MVSSSHLVGGRPGQMHRRRGRRPSHRHRVASGGVDRSEAMGSAPPPQASTARTHPSKVSWIRNAPLALLPKSGVSVRVRVAPACGWQGPNAKSSTNLFLARGCGGGGVGRCRRSLRLATLLQQRGLERRVRLRPQPHCRLCPLRSQHR